MAEPTRTARAYVGHPDAAVWGDFTEADERRRAELDWLIANTPPRKAGPR